MKRKVFLRALRIVQVFLTHFLLHPLNSHRGEAFGERLRKACQCLGVVFTKIGQLLSGRYDLFPEHDLVELRKLLDAADRLPDETMFGILRNELGAEARRLHNLAFLSAAAMAHVYTALLDGKEEVVVKIIRPGICEQAEIDLGILYWVVRAVELTRPAWRRLRISRAVCDLRDWIRAEADLGIELKNMERFRFQLARYFPHGRVRPDLGKLVVPRTYSALSTNRVLTMERLNGITVSEWMRGIRPETGMRYDPRISILTLFVGSFIPLFRGKACLFHGDPHPANLVILEDGNLGLVDFGLMGDYSEELARAFNRMVFAGHLKLAPLFTKALIRFVGIEERYYAELLPDVEVYVRDAFDRGFGDMLKGSLQILLRHRLPGPATLSIIVKFNLLVDALAYEFFPGRSTADLLGTEFEAGIVAQIRHNLGRSKLFDTSLAFAYALSEVVADGPAAVGQIFAGLV
jgi:ubiquinone biosynthesis protein